MVLVEVVMMIRLRLHRSLDIYVVIILQSASSIQQSAYLKAR
jgi:hypothetical protein